MTSIIRRAFLALLVGAIALAALIPALAGPALAQGAAVQRDVSYGRAGGQDLTMDVYTPAGPGPFPGLLVVHPGGFIGGDKADADLVAVAQQFAEAGYVAFSVNYRLAPDFTYPAPLDDLRTAVTFIRGHADQFEVDPTRIGAFGASAGATIAVSLGVEGQGPNCSDDRVAAVVSWSAALDFEKVVAERPDAVPAIEKYTGVLGRGRERQVSEAEEPELLRRAEPITYLDPSDPPIFVANATQEFMPLDQAQSFVERLQELGIPHDFLQPPRHHALHYADEAIGPSIDFLDQYLKSAQCGTAPSPSPSPSPTKRARGGGRKGGSDQLPIVPIAIAGGAAIALAAIGFGLFRLFTRARR